MEELLSGLLSSSSSSSSDFSISDSDDDGLIITRILLDSQIKKTEKSNTNIENFISEVIDKYSEQEFRQHFRVSRPTAEFIIKEFESSEFFHNKYRGKKPIPAKVQILSFLWFAANKSSYREVCDLFKQSFSGFFHHLCLILDFFSKLSKSEITFPLAHNNKVRLAQKFEKIANIQNVIGCIHECNIPVRKLSKISKADPLKHCEEILLRLQGVCDADKKFLDVSIEFPDASQNTQNFSSSSLNTKLQKICEKRFHLLGDFSYPLREYLLTPFQVFDNLTRQQKRYNLKHSQTRLEAENAFSQLKQRFRKLGGLDFGSRDRISKFVLACCVIHNICINHKDYWLQTEADENSEESWAQSEAIDSVEDFNFNEEWKLGEQKRNEIVASF